MQPPNPPQIAAVDVVPAQPTQADSMALTHLSTHTEASLPPVAYVVKVKLKSKPPATSLGWALYVNDVRIPKYWEYEDGIYFTVIDPNFFAEFSWFIKNKQYVVGDLVRAIEREGKTTYVLSIVNQEQLTT